ncbi:ADP-ribosylation factor 1 [Camellia lanceoleosa]|nr:ADP-ribosylation factor 1 [Camellia lanceoleosa]
MEIVFTRLFSSLFGNKLVLGPDNADRLQMGEVVSTIPTFSFASVSALRVGLQLASSLVFILFYFTFYVFGVFVSWFLAKLTIRY